MYITKKGFQISGGKIKLVPFDPNFRWIEEN